MNPHALIIGNSDGIGLASTRRMLADGWSVTGVSRSNSPLYDEKYDHVIADVQNSDYMELLSSEISRKDPVDLCLYCAGIGELLDFENMSTELKTLEVNLLGMVKTATVVIPAMIKKEMTHSNRSSA